MLKWLKNKMSEIFHNEGRPQPMSILDIWRAVMHFPVGCFASWFIIDINPVAGGVFALGFLVYEWMEDWRVVDRSYKDIFGFIIGMGTMGTILHII